MSIGTIGASVGLKDNYTSTANRISSSAHKMGKELTKTQSIAQKLSRQKFEVKMGSLKDKEVKKSLNSLQKNLRDVTGKPYQVKVNTRESFGDVFKRFGSGAKSMVISPVVNTKNLVSAKVEAKKLERELYKTTGKRHKIDIEAPGLKTIKDRLKSVGGGLAGMAKGGLKIAGAGLMAGGAAAGALGGMALKGGFGRLVSIEGAQAKMRGLGHDETAVDMIMSNATASVKGTAFGLGEASTVAAGAVAAGIKPGEELEGMLKSVANSAAAADVGLDEMGSIFNKVATSGKAGNDALQQVSDRGLPIYQKLAEQFGVTTDEVENMASDGKISFKDFEKAMSAASGTVAEEMGKTLPGSFAIFKSALGRVGANLLGGVFPQIAPLFQSLTSAIGPLEERATVLGAKLGELAAGGIAWLQNAASQAGPVLQEIASVAGPFLKSAFDLIASVAKNILWPALKLVGEVAKNVLWPALKVVAEVATTMLFPALKKVGEVAGTVLRPAFDKLGSAARRVGQFLEGLREAVSSAASALRNFNPANLFGGGRKVAPDGHATGGMIRAGETVRWNERGQEYFRSKSGGEIIPAEKTTREISKRVRRVMGATRGGHIINVNVDARGSNMTEDEKKAFRRQLLRDFKRTLYNMPEYA